MADALECDVLVVGGGPVGVTLGLLLAARGVEVLVAEQASEIHPLPRAAHIDHETVRIFQGLGLAEAVMAASRPVSRYDFLTAGGEVLMRFDTGDGPAPSGWPASNMIHQPSIEAALRRALAASSHAALLSNWRFVDAAASADGVKGRFLTPEGERTVAARYLVGCDGARSTVREAMGVSFVDLDFDEPWLVIDTLVHDPARLPSANLQICDPRRPTTCVVMGQGRHRWEFMLLPGETAESVTDDAFVAALLAPWNVEGAVSLERKAVYRFHALVAERWRRGRVFLAGDAAHQMPPFAGQGLCSGLRDAANLAWKLAAVLAGEAGEAILDTYQPEREPHVRAIIDMALLMGRTVCVTDPGQAAARDAAMLAQRAAGSSPGGEVRYPPIVEGLVMAGAPGAGETFPQPRLALAEGGEGLDDRLGPGAWLILGRGEARPASVPAGVGVHALEDPRLCEFQQVMDQWLHRRGCRAVLVRPDRHVFGAGRADDLVAAWTSAMA